MRSLLLAALLASATVLPGAIIFTAEAPGVQQTTLTGVITETFDARPLGPLGAYVSPIGTYTPGANIVAPDAFGGANQTIYPAVGAQSGAIQYSLALNGLQS